MAKRKLLICGSTGFIGRNMAQYFAQHPDFEVFGTYLKSKPLSDLKIKMIKADLTNKDDVKRVVEGMDVIIQAAATTSGARDIIERPYYHVTDNAVMNSLIFRSAYENKVSHVVFFSCTVMYQPSDVPVKETDFDANKDIYPSYFGVGWTKVYIEKMCEFFSKLGGVKYTVLRHSNIYGPYDKFDLEKSHVFGATMTKVMKAPEGTDIEVWGSGEEERDLLYIEDLLNFVALALKGQTEAFGLFNVGCGRSISINDLVNSIIKASGKKIGVRHNLSKPTIKTKLCLDTSKAQKILGWHAKYSLAEGIEKTIEWVRREYGY